MLLLGVDIADFVSAVGMNVRQDLRDLISIDVLGGTPRVFTHQIPKPYIQAVLMLSFCCAQAARDCRE